MLAIIVSILALGLCFVSYKRSNRIDHLQKALIASEVARADVEKVLCDIVDNTGEIKGQFALPSANDHMQTLLAQQEAIDEAKKYVLKAKDDLLRSLKNEMAVSHKLAELVDTSGQVIVKLRLPNEAVSNKPDKTPCGLCRWQWFYTGSKEIFKKDPARCTAYEGRTSASARKIFNDNNGDCIHYEKKT